jgi:hypothetical protein
VVAQTVPIFVYDINTEHLINVEVACTFLDAGCGRTENGNAAGHFNAALAAGKIDGLSTPSDIGTHLEVIKNNIGLAVNLFQNSDLPQVDGGEKMTIHIDFPIHMDKFSDSRKYDQ